jgi:hypothetical protein
MIQSSININKQMRYEVVLLIQLNDVQQINNKVQKQMKVLWTLNIQVPVLGTFFFLSSLLFYFVLNK